MSSHIFLSFWTQSRLRRKLSRVSMLRTFLIFLSRNSDVSRRERTNRIRYFRAVQSLYGPSHILETPARRLDTNKFRSYLLGCDPVYSGTSLLQGRKQQEEPKDGLRRQDNFFGFEVLAGLTIRSAIFWEVTPCSLVIYVSEEHAAFIFRVEE
jgi:hypothetical protein